MCSPEIKSAVLAALLVGQSPSALAEQYQIPAGTIRRWKCEMPEKGQIPKVDMAAFDHTQREKIGDLVITYLHELFTTLVAQQQIFRDRDWLEKQPASELALLHGVLCDKGVRIMEALARSQDAGGE